MPAWSPEIANEFIRLSFVDGRPLTQMQLQKLVYFAHGWNLAIAGTELTRDDPSAFEYGPVYTSLWNALRHYGRRPVTRPIRRGEYFPGMFEDNLPADEPVYPDLNDQEKQIVRRVYRDYGHFEAFQLSAITHEEGSPWNEVYNNGLGRFGEIKADRIRQYFVGLANRPRANQATTA